MRKIVLACAVAALASAGVAGAMALTRHVTLKPGACVTLAKANTRVCAAHVKPKIVTHTETVTNTITQTVTVAPPPPPTQDFSGSGSLTLPPFTVPAATTLHWTLAPGYFGDYGNFIMNCTPSSLFVNALDASSGQTYAQAGTYLCDIIAENAWTIHID